MAADMGKPTLHHGHRCDACGSRAYVHVVIEIGVLNDAGYVSDGELFFCAHHAREHVPLMKARCTILHLIDETRFLADHVKDEGHVTPGQVGRP